MPQRMDENTTRVGKIVYFKDQVLGQGCNGTIVYEGRFEGRPVAVKRILPKFFNIAEREVKLLRSTGDKGHENVVRYYCTEECSEFRYNWLNSTIVNIFSIVLVIIIV